MLLRFQRDRIQSGRWRDHFRPVEATFSGDNFPAERLKRGVPESGQLS